MENKDNKKRKGRKRKFCGNKFTGPLVEEDKSEDLGIQQQQEQELAEEQKGLSKNKNR